MPTRRPPARVMIGQVLGHYRILETIGSGGMGEVFRARDDRLQRDVALKLLKSSLKGQPDRIRRFEHEARAAAALSHPNIVAVYDVGVQDGTPYIVSELLEGQTLRQRLLEGPLSVRQAGEIGSQVAEGLVCAHEKRIIHRDLKPENLFITRDGRVKILDFGIAKLTVQEEDQGDSLVSRTTQTRAGSVLGTVGYMSPEQLRGKPVDHRSDIFSLGAILYEMLTGQRAFSGETDVDTMMAVLQQEPAEMVVVRQNIPASLEQIVRHCLEKEPADRFQSAQDLAFALKSASASTTTQYLIGRRLGWSRARKWIPWLAAAALIAAAGIFLGARLRPQPRPEYRRITFERGTVYSARFSPDGHGILYGASWNGGVQELYSTVEDSPLARPLGLKSAYLLAISPQSELALSLKWKHGSRRDLIGGVLARSPLAGGTPREMLEDVRWADWSPDGRLAVVHYANDRNRLEFPIGNVLYQTNGWISNIRFSPKGDRIAFMDHPASWDNRGSVCVIDWAGHRSVLSDGWESEDGLAWSPRGDEVWFTAAENSTSNRLLWAVDLSGHRRQVFAVPGGFTLQDIAADGRVLITMDSERLAMEWTGQDGPKIQDLSWYDWSIAKEISHDGQWVLFEEGSGPVGSNYAVAIRNIDGSPPIRLGDGSVGGLSPDGKWAVSVFTGVPQHLILLPIGPGETRQIPVPGLDHIENGSARFLADGKRAVLDGYAAGRPGRSWVVDLSASHPPQPITPEGFYATLPSPDGGFVAGENTDGKIMLFPLAGGRTVTLQPDGGPFEVLQWSADSRSLYLQPSGAMPAQISRLDIATGKVSPVRELTSADRAGVVSIGPVVTNSTASEFAYSYYQVFSVMYVISGLR